jgi:hypothetical protein
MKASTGNSRGLRSNSRKIFFSFSFIFNGFIGSLSAKKRKIIDFSADDDLKDINYHRMKNGYKEPLRTSYLQNTIVAT